MSITIPPRKSELAHLLDTTDPHEQATRVRVLQAQASAPVEVLTLVLDRRHNEITLGATGEDLSIAQALHIVERARCYLLQEKARLEMEALARGQ